MLLLQTGKSCCKQKLRISARAGIGRDWHYRFNVQNGPGMVSRGAFCCAFPVNFGLIRETAGMRLRQFPARETRKEKKQ